MDFLFASCLLDWGAHNFLFYGHTGTMLHDSHIILSPLLPPIYLWLLGITALLLGCYGLIRKARGAVLRIMLSAILLILLLNPSLVQQDKQSVPDTVLIVQDDSQSLHLGQRPDLMRSAMEKVTARIQALPDLTTEQLVVSGKDDTRLLSAISARLSTLATKNLSAILVLSDGQIHDADGFDAKTLGVPLHSLIIGGKKESDRRLNIIQSPAYGVVGKGVTLKLRLEDSEASTKDTTVPLMITQDDGTSFTQPVLIGQDATIELPVKHGGKNHFVIESPVRVSPDGHSELVRENNTALVAVQGVRDRLRVLLISSQPHIGGRTWRDFLKSDPAVDMIHFTLLRTQSQFDGTPDKELALIAFPVPQLFGEKLASFDLVIFDRYRNAMPIPDYYLANIATYVKKGGALLLTTATDQPSAMLSVSPLATVLPAPALFDIATQPFTPTLTALGRDHPVTSALPRLMPEKEWGNWYRMATPDRASHPEGQIVMTGSGKAPLLILKRVGEGRVAELTSDQIWLWSRNHKGGGPAEELLRRIAHWLMKEPELDEKAITTSVTKTDAGWQIAITTTALQGQETATLETPDGQKTPIAFSATPNDGKSEAHIDVNKAGLYRVIRDDLATLVPVGIGTSQEMSAVLPTDSVLSPISKATGGGVYRITTDADVPAMRRTAKSESQAGQSWAGIRRNEASIIVGSHTLSLLPPLLAFLAVIATACLLWWREGKSS